MDDFYKFAHITMALVDLKGNVLVSVGWQDICTRFHRVHPEACKHCIESDTKLSAGVAPGEFRLYKCKNHMWDIATPIMVGGQHVGNIFSGQFFFEGEPLDYELFQSQAKKYGFNEKEYIAALEKVPRLSRETVNTGTAFLTKLANMLSQLSHSNIKLAQSLEERDTLVDKLEKKSEDFDRAQAVGNIGSWRLDVCKNELTWSDENHRIFGIPKVTPLTYETFLSTVHPDDREYVDKEWKASLKDKPHEIEHRIIVDGKIKWVREKAYLEFDKDGAVVSGFGITQDITEHRQAEHQLSNELARATGLYELYTRSSNLSDRELYDFALNQAVKITDSTIGFFHLVSEDEKKIILTTWDQETLRSCTAGNEGHYPIEKAGNWVDCVRLKRPVVYNDFPSSPNQKGLPAGHATVKRFMSAPVTENDKVRIIFGVGNKVDEYDDRDVMQLQLVANELHKIMKLRRIENEVREREAFLRDIMENVSDAIFVKDREARMILANPAYYRLMGKSPEEVLNKTVADFHPPEIAKKLAEDDKRVMETGKGTTLEERIFTSHGWRILQTVKAPYYDGQGNIIGLIGTARDITERKKAEEALRLSNVYNRSLIEANLDPLVTIGRDGKIMDVNGATEKVTGDSRNDLIGTDFSDYYTEPEKAFAGYQQVFTNGEVRDYPLEIQHKDGHITPVLYNASVYRDENGEVIGVFASARDITERKRAEETLAFERSQLLSIFDGIDDVVYVTDPYTYEVLYANKAMKEKFGGELVGGICYREFQRKDFPCDFCTNQIILKERDKHYHWEYYNPMVNRYFMIVDRIIKWPDGRDVRSEIAKDITERKRAEDALKKAHNHLEEKVKERTAELDKAYNSLKESEKGLAEAQRMAHIGNWKWNIVTNEKYWSDEIYRIFGHSPQEFEATYDTFIGYIHPDDRDYVDNVTKSVS